MLTTIMSTATTLTRTTLALAGAVAVVALTAQTAQAQTPPKSTPELQFLVSSGTIVPTGALRDDVKRGNVTVAQFLYVARPRIAITASLGWARSRELSTAGNPKINVFTSDLGAEVRAPRWMAGRGVSFSPFSGVGAGARSYDYRGVKSDARYNMSGYLSAGGEIARGRVGLRFEVRDYLSGFTRLDGAGATSARNDVVVMTGLRIGRR